MELAIGLVFGMGGFIWGFMRLRRKRLIENIPTSTVRGLALGLVEVVGQAKERFSLVSPFTISRCAFYQYQIESYRRSGKHSRWVTIAKGDSSWCRFYVEDETGKILVSPRGAEVILPVFYEFTTGWGKTISGNLLDFMQAHHIRYGGFLGESKLRFKEWIIAPDEKLYILGTAQKSREFLEEHNTLLVKRLEELKSNPAKMADVDSDKDGEVSPEEWDVAVAQMEQRVLEEQLKSAGSPELADVVIGQKETGEVFIISTHSQKDLIHSLYWQALIGIYGGAALTVIVLWYLLGRWWYGVPRF